MDKLTNRIICSKKLNFLSSDGQKKKVLAILHEPQKVNELEFTCEVRLQGFKEIGQITGVDSFQALTLGINIMKTLLDSYINKGGKITDEFGEEISTDLMFSST